MVVPRMKGPGEFLLHEMYKYMYRYCFTLGPYLMACILKQ